MGLGEPSASLPILLPVPADVPQRRPRVRGTTFLSSLSFHEHEEWKGHYIGVCFLAPPTTWVRFGGSPNPSSLAPGDSQLHTRI